MVDAGGVVAGGHDGVGEGRGPVRVGGRVGADGLLVLGRVGRGRVAVGEDGCGLVYVIDGHRVGYGVSILLAVVYCDRHRVDIVGIRIRWIFEIWRAGESECVGGRGDRAGEIAAVCSTQGTSVGIDGICISDCYVGLDCRNALIDVGSRVRRCISWSDVVDIIYGD